MWYSWVAQVIKLLSWKPSDLYDDVMCWFWSIQIFRAPPPSAKIFSEPPLRVSKHFRSPSSISASLPLVILNELSLNTHISIFNILVNGNDHKISILPFHVQLLAVSCDPACYWETIRACPVIIFWSAENTCNNPRIGKMMSKEYHL